MIIYLPGKAGKSLVNKINMDALKFTKESLLRNRLVLKAMKNNKPEDGFYFDFTISKEKL